MEDWSNAMGTFTKIKKFNLNSTNAKDVDVKTPISDVRNAENIDAFEEARKIVTYLGNLCKWNGKVGFFKPLVTKSSSAVG